MFCDASPEDAIEIIETNVLGTMLGIREAIRVMRDQETGGHIWSMDGAGADGNPTPRFAVYGATKRSLAQFNKSIRAELKSMGLNKIGVHDLSPGMVTTELLMAGKSIQIRQPEGPVRTHNRRPCIGAHP